ncbi:hypothetical protein [Poriferisphaera sp. WC338]|uniref:hypothetical protein n=1 Tax=Poriferisphaera sp. WC338 TaxID=3425129 RepID=UPI003D81BE9C
MKFLSVLSLVMIFAVSVGCTSFDRHVYESSQLRPTTLTIVKVPGDEPLWSYDIPVGYKLVVDFNTDDQIGNNKNSSTVNPTEMTWKLIKGSEEDVSGLYMTTKAEESGVVSLPGTDIRQIVTLREMNGEEQARTFDVESAEVVSDGKIEPIEKGVEEAHGAEDAGENHDEAAGE